MPKSGREFQLPLCSLNGILIFLSAYNQRSYYYPHLHIYYAYHHGHPCGEDPRVFYNTVPSLHHTFRFT